MAPVKCHYQNCTNTNETKSIFSFPVKDETRLKLWIQHSGNSYLKSLTFEELKRRYICEDHFKPEDVLKHSSRARLAYRAVPLMWKPVTPQYTDDVSVENTAGKCSECSHIISGYRWWCLQCPGDRCHGCAWRVRHYRHLLLRVPANANYEKTKDVLESIKNQLPDDLFNIQDGIGHVDENGIDMEATDEPEVKAEPLEVEEDDPLAGCNPIPVIPKEPPSMHCAHIPDNHIPNNPNTDSIDYNPPKNIKERTSIDYNFPSNTEKPSSIYYNPPNNPERLSPIDYNLPNNPKKPPSIMDKPHKPKKTPFINKTNNNYTKKSTSNPNNPKTPSIDYQPVPDRFRSDLQNRPINQPDYMELFHESPRLGAEIVSPAHPGLDDYEFSLAECSGIDDFRVTDRDHLCDDDHRPPSMTQSPNHTNTYSHDDGYSAIETSDYSSLEIHSDVIKDPLDTTEQENDNQLKRPSIQVISAGSSTASTEKKLKVQPRVFANKKSTRSTQKNYNTDKPQTLNQKSNTKVNRPEQLGKTGQSPEKSKQQDNHNKTKRLQYATHIRRDIVPFSDDEIDNDRVRQMDTRDIDVRSDAKTTLLDFEDIIRKKVFEYPIDIEELT